jgi:prepilin-type N-terminal cleavage/methylation domain-containing protein
MRIADYPVRNKIQDRMHVGDYGDPTPNDSTEFVEVSERSLPSNSLIGGTPNSKGFTLIEIVITIVLVSILAGIAAMIIMQGVAVYSDEQSRSNVHYQARIAMERMAREIRMIRSTADITDFTATNLRFTDVSGTTLGFEWINLTRTLNRWNGASDDVLASGINPLVFSYFENDGVTPAVLVDDVWFVDIAMTSVQGLESLPMRTRVHPRNFYQ